MRGAPAHAPPPNDSGGRGSRPPRQQIAPKERTIRHALNDVDLGRQIARDLEAHFLLANLRRIPNLHDSFPPERHQIPLMSAPPRDNHWCATFFFVPRQSADRPCFVKARTDHLVRYRSCERRRSQFTTPHKLVFEVSGTRGENTAWRAHRACARSRTAALAARECGY